jgi:hypothetical protein
LKTGNARKLQGNAAQSCNKLQYKKVTKSNKKRQKETPKKRETMSGRKLERFSLSAILDALNGSDVIKARLALSAVIGADLEVSGKVEKRVKRDGQCKLVIQPGASVPGFVVFADCQPDAAKVTARKIRKGSFVSVRGKLLSFGSAAVCLSDCYLS